MEIINYILKHIILIINKLHKKTLKIMYLLKSVLKFSTNKYRNSKFLKLFTCINIRYRTHFILFKVLINNKTNNNKTVKQCKQAVLNLSTLNL